MFVQIDSLPSVYSLFKTIATVKETMKELAPSMPGSGNHGHTA
jgi:hypothetical protein